MKTLTKEEINAIRSACWNAIYDKIYDSEGADIRGLALLHEILGVFPNKLFTVCPELKALYQKLENREVKL